MFFLVLYLFCFLSNNLVILYAFLNFEVLVHIFDNHNYYIYVLEAIAKMLHV